jgi:hypothetical protein
MRKTIALVLAAAIGVAASAYTPSAKAAVVVGVGVAAPVYTPWVAPAPVAPLYWGAGSYWRAPFYNGGYWGYRRDYGGYGHPGYGYRGWGYRRR